MGPAGVVRVARRRERKVQEVAARQLGLVTREQLVAAGLGSGQVRRWVEQGRLHRLHRGVYVLGHRELAPWARELAAVLAMGARARVSHRSAAAVWGMLPEGRGPVDVLVPGRKPCNRPGIRVHRSERITPKDFTSRRRLPVTTPERTLVDLAGTGDHRDLEEALEAARIQRAVSESRLREAVMRARHTTGARALRTLLDAEGEPAVTRSRMERRTLALVRAAGLAAPRVNSLVAGHEVDLCWPAHGLVVELDSYGFHSSRSAFENDRLKQTRLVAAGFTVLRLTWRRVSEQPEATVADLAGALARTERRPTS